MNNEKRRREIGYVCGRGHYQFIGEDDYGACGSKKMATIYVEAMYADADMFDETDDRYIAADYERDIDEAHAGLVQMLQERSA